jgi:hypothetical protein
MGLMRTKRNSFFDYDRAMWGVSRHKLTAINKLVKIKTQTKWENNPHAENLFKSSRPV